MVWTFKQRGDASKEHVQVLDWKPGSDCQSWIQDCFFQFTSLMPKVRAVCPQLHTVALRCGLTWDWHGRLNSKIKKKFQVPRCFNFDNGIFTCCLSIVVLTHCISGYFRHIHRRLCSASGMSMRKSFSPSPMCTSFLQWISHAKQIMPAA